MSTSLTVIDMTAVAPRKPATITLFDAEEYLAALLDTEEMVTPEQEAEFRLTLQNSLQTAKAKRDSVQKFLAHCDSQVRLADDEIARIAARKAGFAKAAERLESYVVAVIQIISEPDAKGKYPKLEGNTTTLGIRRNPASVNVLDEKVVPDGFKTVAVTMPVYVLEQITTELEFAESPMAKELSLAARSVSVKKAAIKKALDAGDVVPGAEIKQGAYRLEVK